MGYEDYFEQQGTATYMSNYTRLSAQGLLRFEEKRHVEHETWETEFYGEGIVVGGLVGTALHGEQFNGTSLDRIHGDRGRW